MLPKQYRLILRNNTGAVLSAVDKLVAIPWYFDSTNNGQLTYGSEIDLAPSAAPADGQWAASATPVSSNTNFGFKGIVGASGAGSGNVEVFIEWANDAGVWPTAKLLATDDPTPFVVQLAVTPVVAGGREAIFTYE